MTPPPSHRDRGVVAEVKAFYSLKEYAILTGQTLKAVQHQADRGVLRTGRVPGKKMRVVFLSQLKGEHPDLWASLATASQVRGVSRR